MAENQQNLSLSRSQERALAALISQPTITLAAAEAKVGQRTLYRWLAEDQAFKSEYLRVRRRIVNNAVFQIQKATDNAVNVTIGLMNDPETPATARLAAARTVLEMSLNALQVEELEERIRVLEARLEENAVFGKQAFPNGAQVRNHQYGG
jgi:uncharacterized small protein (DUF1192 family)